MGGLGEGEEGSRDNCSAVGMDRLGGLGGKLGVARA